MFVNVIKSYRDVIAICDSDLLGKKFEQGKFQLDVKENFYKGEQGEKVSEEELTKIIKSFSAEDATFNIIGKKSVAVAIKTGMISEKGIKKIQGVPYALVLL